MPISAPPAFPDAGFSDDFFDLTILFFSRESAI
jgi:hypothetical protein